MAKPRTLANTVSNGGVLADGTVAAAEVSGLATVATSGSYNDLSNLPAASLPLTGGTMSGNITFAGAQTYGGVRITQGVGANSSNIAIGPSALSSASLTGWPNLAIGEGAGQSITNGSANVALGHNAMVLGAAASSNTAVGANSLYTNNSNNNTAIGKGALYQATGSGNTAVGESAGNAITSGNQNVIIGSNDGSGISGTNRNVVISDGFGAVKMQFNQAGALGAAGANFGTAGQVLTSQGNAAVPVWADAAGGLTFQFPYSENITAGDVVQLLTSGQVEKVKVNNLPFAAPSGAYADLSAGDSAVSVSMRVVVDPFDSNRFAIAYYQANGIGYPKLCIGTISGTTVTLGSVVTLETVSAYDVQLKWNPKVQNDLAVVWASSASSGMIKAVIATVSGTTATLGSRYDGPFRTTNRFDFDFHPTSSYTGIVIGFGAQNNSNYASIGTYQLGGSVFTGYQGPYVVRSSQSSEMSVAYEKNSTRLMMIFGVYQAGNNATWACPCDVNSNGTVSVGSNYTIESSIYGQFTTIAAHPTTAGRYAIAYANGNAATPGRARIIDWAPGTSTFTLGSSANFSTNGYPEGNKISFDPSDSSKLVVTYLDGSTGQQIYINSGTVSGNTPTFSTPTLLIADTVNNARQPSHAMIPGSPGKFVYVAPIYSAAKVATGQFAAAVSNLSASTIVGVAQQTRTTGQIGVVALKGGVDGTRSGLTPQSTYYVQSDGTVSTASASPAVKLGRAISATSILLVGEQ